MWSYGDSHYTVNGIWIGALRKIFWHYSSKVTMHQHQDPAIPISGWKTLATENLHMCAREHIQKDMARSFIKVKNWKQFKCPSTLEWIAKLWYTSTMSSI